MLDRADRLLDRKAVGGRVAGIEADRNIAAIIFGIDRTDPARKRGERLQRQQRVVDEVVTDQGRLLGIGGGEGGTRRCVESNAGHGISPAERRRSVPMPISSARQAAKATKAAQAPEGPHGDTDDVAPARPEAVDHRMILDRAAVHPGDARRDPRIFRFSSWISTPGESAHIARRSRS